MSTLRIRRLGYALGAEITGLDLSRHLRDETVGEIRKAWLDHVVLCFPGQNLTREEMMAFCSRFGELEDNQSQPELQHPDAAAVMVLVNKPTVVRERTFNGGIADEWHSDLSFSERPTSASFLNAQELPETGGDTLFANMYAAYEALSPALRDLIEPLEAVHDGSLSRAVRRLSPAEQAERRRLSPPVAHPLVRVHPETDRKALFIGHRIRHFVGMTEEETKPILDFLNDHAVRYEFTYRHVWSVHDLVMWDNRSAMHVAVPDYDLTQMRRMQRCSLRTSKSGYVYSPETPATLSSQ